MTDLLSSSDSGGYSTDPSRPDYACPQYREMSPRWSIVNDIRAGTPVIRAKKEKYLPKFEAETVKDWDGRVGMTFVADHYATTLTEHVGLVMAEPITLGKDVPVAIQDLCEDIDGEGNHLDVFGQSALDAAIHLGHAVLLTDYPDPSQFKHKGDENMAKARPYVQLYRADDVLSWQTATVGGVKVLARIILRECSTESDGAFGVKEAIRYREITQQVFYDEITGRATGLGGITWRAWRQTDDTEANGGVSFQDAGSGPVIGPSRIPARIVYGGEKIGFLHSKPLLYGLALSNIEETQVGSDYACVMHKCNVPTPIFVGRNVNALDGAPQTVQMGQGIDIPIGGSATMLEPTGAAIGATRTRLQDIQLLMQRQGAAAASPGEGGKALTATEAAQVAKARSAKLKRAARSLQDAIEGVLADFASFMKIAPTGSVKSGGSVTVNQNIAGLTLDPAYLTVIVTAYSQGVLTIGELRYVLQAGQLPEDFDPEDEAILQELMAQEAARQTQQQIDAAANADAQKNKDTLAPAA